MKKLIKFFWILVWGGIFLVGLGLRLYRIDQPVADWHSHRQADTASVTREYLKNGIDLLVPKYHDLSNVQSGQENPEGYRMVELPLYNVLGVLAAKLGMPMETGMRGLSILFSVITTIFIFLLSKKITQNQHAALLSAGVFWAMPFSGYYSRAILPESMALATMVSGVYFFKKKLFWSAVLMSISILVKPYTALVAGPILGWWVMEDLRKGVTLKKLMSLIVFALMTLGPFAAWRWWIQQYPSGIPYSKWLFNFSDKPIMREWWNGINFTFINHLVAFRPSWFRWIYIERISKLILGTFGIIPLFLGLAYRRGKNQMQTAFMLLGILVYTVVVAGGNLRHDYYQVMALPFLSIVVGSGIFYMQNFVFKSRLWALAASGLVLALAWWMSWDQVKNYYQINNPTIIEAGKKADEILGKEDLIIAPYDGDTAFLYQTNRRGWPTQIYNIDDIKKLQSGRKIYLLSVNMDDFTNKMMEKYPVFYQGDKFIILDINNEK